VSNRFPIFWLEFWAAASARTFYEREGFRTRVSGGRAGVRRSRWSCLHGTHGCHADTYHHTSNLRARCRTLPGLRHHMNSAKANTRRPDVAYNLDDYPPPRVATLPDVIAPRRPTFGESLGGCRRRLDGHPPAGGVSSCAHTRDPGPARTTGLLQLADLDQRTAPAARRLQAWPPSAASSRRLECAVLVAR